jgi:hypothetical protein
MASGITPSEAAIPQWACDLVSQRRQIQQNILKWKDKDIGTIVLTFMNHNMVYASIASTESLDFGLFASYHREPPVGILCRKEGAVESGVTFLDPIWIWHESRS